MLLGVFRTKERKIIAVILGLLIIIISVVVFLNYSKNKEYREQAVMAENFLKAGNYEQAVEAYDKAMSMKEVNKKILSIGLSEAYVGMKDYDKALDVLRSCYQETSDIKVKEKIEEVTTEKTEYEYLQTASRAEVYYSNKEYDKAIAEYEKAKLIKSKEVTAYKRIAQAYMEQKEYSLAREEILEGQERTQDKSLDELLATVDAYLTKDQYNLLIKQASEYIYQENYKDGRAYYQEAITLLPHESQAYIGLAEAFISQEEYNKSILLLRAAVRFVTNDSMDVLLHKAESLKEAQEEKNNILYKLLQALKSKNIATAAKVMQTNIFLNTIVNNAPVYYSDKKAAKSDQTMIVYGRDQVYLGNADNEVKKGQGIYLQLSGQKDYYFYEGEWYNDLPNGMGRTEEVATLQDDTGNKYESKTVTEGNYDNAYENGSMTKCFYVNEEETGEVKYTSKNGIPQPLVEEDILSLAAPEDGSYKIGKVAVGDQLTEEYYTVEPDTIWGVKEFIENE